VISTWGESAFIIWSRLLMEVNQLQDMIASSSSDHIPHLWDKSEFAGMHSDEILKHNSTWSALTFAHIWRSRAMSETLFFELMQHISHDAISVHDWIIK